MPIDFSSLSGEDFEFFCRDLLESIGIEIVEGPSRGPDRKKDLIIRYSVKDVIGRHQNYKFLVQCKNKAVSNKSVYESELGDIRSACKIHNTDGYFLITTTIPSTSVQDNFKAINQEGQYITHYWDRFTLEKYISECRDGINLLERYGLLRTRYKLYQYMGLVPDEFDLIQKINQKLGFELSIILDYKKQISIPNSCYIVYGNVRSLHIDDHPIGNLIDKLNMFKEIVHLELNNIELDIIPNSIFKMVHLRILYLPMNNVSFIPSEIINIKDLKEFDISNNPIEQIDIGCEFIKKLEQFWIDKSQILLFKNIFKELKKNNIPLSSKNIEIEGFSPNEVDNYFRNL
ncbi:MAG: restriction endonuclease [Promethearchaeota archaeon]